MLRMERFTHDLFEDEQRYLNEVSIVRRKIAGDECLYNTIETFFDFLIALTFTRRTVKTVLREFLNDLDKEDEEV